MKATATAHPNIALVKYWGKRDERLVLPHQSSLSVTLGPLSVTTTVELDPRLPADEVVLSGHAATGSRRERVVAVLERLRAERRFGPARVVSQGDFPVAAGLASSAAAFAALALAARAASGAGGAVADASRLARFGSGSAARSVQGGFCLWRRGEREDGADSFAEQLLPADHWPSLRMLAALVSVEEKEVGSRQGMRTTVETSPYYPAWVAAAEADVARVGEACRARDLEAVGALAERNAWRMHATALAADPPLCYLAPGTLELIRALPAARRRGLPVWFTLDAGPNPVLLTDAAHEDAAESLARECGAREVICCRVGDDARLVDGHLC